MRTEEPAREAARPARSERPSEPEWKPRRLMTEEEKKRNNYECRQAKKERKAAWKATGKSKGKSSGKGKGSGREAPSQVSQLERFGWICAVGEDLNLLDDEEAAPAAAEVVEPGEPSEAADPAAEVKVLAEGTGWKTTGSGEPVLVKAGAVVFQVPLAKHSAHALRTTWSRKDGVWTKIEDRVSWKTMDDPSGLIPNVGERLVTIFHKPEVPLSAESGSGHLHADSKVSDLKRRLKELHAPVWGTKAQLWERLQEREAELEYHRGVEKAKAEREEALNVDPEQARHPMVLEGPEPPSAVERELHELTHLPFAPWCEACVRGRGKDMPHRKVEPVERRLMPMVCLDWFVAASSDEQGQKVEGATDVLLLTDAETGYVAAIPAKSKSAESHPHLVEMVVKFLGLMRHEKVKLRSDGEPAIKALVQKVKDRWSQKHTTLVEDTPLYSSPSNGRAERAIQTVRRLASSLKVHAEVKLKCALTPEQPGWPWIVRHSAWLHNRFHVKANGRTCFEELHQTRYKQDVVPWGEKVLFMEPRPKHRRLKGGRRHQKMDAAMESGIWLGRSEEIDEHLLGTPRGVMRARTIRRLIPQDRWDAQSFLEFRGVPWDVSSGALPVGFRPKVMLHFSLPADEVVPQPDGGLLTAGDEESEGYVPTTPPDLEQDQQGVAEDVGEPEVFLSPRSAPSGPATPRTPARKRQSEGEAEGREPKTLVREETPPSSPTKRAAETPVESLDPRVDPPEEPGSASAGGVLQVHETVDEDPEPMPEEAWECLDTDEVDCRTSDHPDNWSEERWLQESLKGKAKELGCLRDYGVYKPVPRAQSAGGKYISTRWEEVPKWKEGKWIVRSRFVAREFKWKDPGRDDIFGVTSSANTGRILDYLVAKKQLRVYLADVECAFFHAPEADEVYVEPPAEWKEDHPDQDYVWQLVKQLYGRRPAPRAFSDFVAGVLIDEIGMKRCVEVPHLYYHEETEVCLEVHVDDFYAVGPGESAGNLLRKIGQYLTLKVEGPYDEGSTFVHLKRVRTVTTEGVYISASPNHLKKLLKALDLTEDSKGRDTPITKPVVGSDQDEELPVEQWTQFRGVVGILMYMSTDRPDIQYTVNELSSLMSKPTQRGWESAKHLVRYLLKTKDYALFFGREAENCDDVVIMTDSDWATDQQNRKSKSAVHIYVGDCLLYSYTRRQTVIAQSSAEAEFYATASGVSEGILLRKVLAFFGLPLGLRVLTDSAANNAMAHRLGVGKVRHLETKVLWLQQLVYQGLLTMTWRAGRFNNADLGTKVLQKARFLELVEKAGLRDRAKEDAIVHQVKKVQTTGPTSEQIAQAIVVLASLTHLPQAKGQAIEKALEVSDPFEMSLVLILLVPFLIGMFWGSLSLWIWWRCRRPRTDPLILYKAPAGVVLHLDKKCHYLKKRA